MLKGNIYTIIEIQIICVTVWVKIALVQTISLGYFLKHKSSQHHNQGHYLCTPNPM